MAKKRRIKARKPSKSASRIQPQPAALEDDIVRFSFKHLDLAHPKFSIAKQGTAYLHSLLDRLKAISALKVMEFLSNRSSALRVHPIDWADTSEPDGFTHLNEQLRDLTAYQFQISANAHGRVHGFMIDYVFFVVWLDPDHRLYP